MAKDITLKSPNGEEIYYPKTVTDLVFDNNTGKTLKEKLDNIKSVKKIDWLGSETDTLGQIPLEERKDGMIVMFNIPKYGEYCKLYAKEDVSDSLFLNTVNWIDIPLTELTSKIPVDTVDKTNSEVEGYVINNYSIWHLSNNQPYASTTFDIKVFPLESGKKYKIKNRNKGDGLADIAIAIKTGNNGDGLDYQLLTKNDVFVKYPKLDKGIINYEQGCVMKPNEDEVTIEPYYYYNNPSEKLYIICGWRYMTYYNSAIVVEDIKVESSYEKVYKIKYGSLDNFDYIKNKACEYIEVPTKNLITDSCVAPNLGVIYNKWSIEAASTFYKCCIIPINFDSYYSISGFSGLTSGADSCAFMTLEDSGKLRGLTTDDFKQISWITNNKFTYSSTNKAVYKKGLNNNPFSFKAPDKTDLNNIDKLFLCVNCHFANTDTFETLQVEQNPTPTEYIKGGTNKELSKIFGHEISTNPSKIETSSTVSNDIKGKVIFFFGDSITQGTDGGYVNLIKNKLNLGVGENYGSSGARTGRLVDIMTGLNIREGSYIPIDYNTCHAITIMIGTNGGVTGSFDNDIPNISLSEIDSFPYQFTNSNGETISIANETEYFKTMFKDSFYGNIALCLEFVRWKNPKCKIFLITIPPSDRGNHKQVREALLKIGELYAVEVIDAQINAGLCLKNLSNVTIDGTHLNYYGNELWASYIANQIKQRFYIINETN